MRGAWIEMDASRLKAGATTSLPIQGAWIIITHIPKNGPHDPLAKVYYITYNEITNEPKAEHQAAGD